ncbi:hypothetical protein [Pseudomonas guariconensis]|nr:hypothetical protein [Pseudomonas guariconensis]
MDEWQVKENKEEKFKKALFLCLFLGTHDAVDKSIQPSIHGALVSSKPCA